MTRAIPVIIVTSLVTGGPGLGLVGCGATHTNTPGHQHTPLQCSWRASMIHLSIYLSCVCLDNSSDCF